MIDGTKLQQFGITCSADTAFAGLGLIDSDQSGTLTFLDNELYVAKLNRNPNIAGVITTEGCASRMRTDLQRFYTDDPRFVFYSLYNQVAEETRTKQPTVIGRAPSISPSASIAEFNVRIGDHVCIEPNVTILPDVVIGSNVVIYAGSVVGAEGFEHKRTSRGLLAVRHDGSVIIEDGVIVGACNTIAKGLAHRNTVLGADSRLDNLVHVAHCVHVGRRCLITAGAILAGSATIGDDVWIGPNATVSSGVRVGKGAFVTIGAVVIRDVEPAATVTGNFAMQHKDFLRDWMRKMQ